MEELYLCLGFVLMVVGIGTVVLFFQLSTCLLYTSPSPRD